MWAVSWGIYRSVWLAYHFQMENIHKRVHFPYQHPLFGRTTGVTSGASVRKSVYFWWWEYLRRSSAYKKALEEGAKTERMARLIADFGDVYGSDFRNWWRNEQRGARLFSTLDQKQVAIREVRTDEQGVNYLEITVPLNLPRRHIEKKLKSFLDTHHKGKRGRQNARVQVANYSVSRPPNVTALETALSVYDVRKQHPELSMWRVAVLAIPKYKPYRDRLKDPNFKLDYDQRRQAAVEVHRYLKQVQLSIKNAEQGVFP
jgi:hypothetical protein